MSESKGSFFRQSAWLGAATLVGGALMTAVHSSAAKMPGDEYATFGTVLRLFLMLAIPSVGVQVVFAQRAAAALTDANHRTLSRAARGISAAIFVIWLPMLLAGILCKDQLVAGFELGSTAVLWPTLGVALTWMLLPVFRGILQGEQNFAALGWVAILDGVGRFGSVVLMVALFHATAAGAMYGALVGQLLSIGIAVWSTRKVWMGPGGPVEWGQWILRIIPYTLGGGGLLVLANFDYPFIKANIPAADAVAHLYYPASMIGFALTQITVPLATVMFPKIARSAASGHKTDAMTQALLGTALFGSLSGIAVMVLPQLPLRILYFTKPENWVAAPLVPWFVWTMLLYALANVIVNNLLARDRFSIVPIVVAVAGLYAGGLLWLKPRLVAMEPLAAFKITILMVAGANLLLMILGLLVMWRNKVTTRTP
jgi:O-antigen/teichoic acid export membrane protein